MSTVDDIQNKEGFLIVYGHKTGFLYALHDHDSFWGVSGDGADFSCDSKQGCIELINTYLEPRYDGR